MTFLLGWLSFHRRHQTKDLRAFRVLYVTKNDSNRASLGTRSVTVRLRPGLDQFHHDFNVAACGVRITAELVVCVEQVLSNLVIDSRQADIETSREG